MSRHTLIVSECLCCEWRNKNDDKPHCYKNKDLRLEVKYNSNKKDWFPWELWEGNNLIDAFAAKEVADERKKLLIEINKLKEIVNP